MELPVTLQEKIVVFLKSLPNIDETKSRRAFIYSAGLDQQLIEQIPFDEPPANFVPILVSILLKYEKLKDNRYALEAVLKETQKYIGANRQEDCRCLLQELQRYFEQHPSNYSKQKDNNKQDITLQWNKKFIGLLAFIVILSIVSIAIFVWGKPVIWAIFESSQKEKVYYTVKLVLPSRMSGADIYVDKQPAKILEQTPTIVIIQVEKKQENHQFVVQKTDKRCTKTQFIQKNDETIFICQ